VNLSAMTIFLWHQTALMATTATGLLLGRLPGLHTSPDHLTWVAARLLWLPAFALTLAVCWAAFHTYEHPGTPPRSRTHIRTHTRSRTHTRTHTRTRTRSRVARSRIVRTHRSSDRATPAGARHV
jgi:peptidoglycan/LPS O-acetylase OafA/YrhL